MTRSEGRDSVTICLSMSPRTLSPCRCLVAVEPVLESPALATTQPLTEDASPEEIRAAALESIWIDRDLSWLEFNRRVLAEAFDERTPLLERVKFLAIFSSNLDEFFMKRMAVLRERPAVARELLKEIRARLLVM